MRSPVLLYWIGRVVFRLHHQSGAQTYATSITQRSLYGLCHVLRAGSFTRTNPPNEVCPTSHQVGPAILLQSPCRDLDYGLFLGGCSRRRKHRWWTSRGQQRKVTDHDLILGFVPTQRSTQKVLDNFYILIQRFVHQPGVQSQVDFCRAGRGWSRG